LAVGLSKVAQVVEEVTESVCMVASVRSISRCFHRQWAMPSCLRLNVSLHTF
jgi:hypothetical protein